MGQPEQSITSRNTLPLADAGNIAVPFASSSTYHMPNTNASATNIVDSAFPSFSSPSTTTFANLETFRLPQSFNAPLAAVPPNHISPSASEGQRSTSSQPGQRNQRHQSIEDGPTRIAPPAESEKSPHVFTSVRFDCQTGRYVFQLSSPIAVRRLWKC